MFIDLMKKYFKIYIKYKLLIHQINKKFICGKKSEKKFKFLIYIKFIDQNKDSQKNKLKLKIKMEYLLQVFQAQEKQLFSLKWLESN